MTVATHGVSSSSADRLLKEAGVIYLYYYDTDSPGTLLGATQGGNTFTIDRKFRDIRPDGAKGPVKGFRRLESVDVRLEVNLLECTAESIRRALAGSAYSSGTTLVEDEAVGDGDGSTKEFSLDHTLVEENSETIYLEGVAKVRGTDYTMEYTTGKIQFFVAPGSGASYSITATYKYVGGGVMAGAEVSATTGSGDYIEVVALLVNLTGYTSPAIFKLKNCLVEGAAAIEAKPSSETVRKLVFVGHYTAAALTTEPWEIIYPAS